MEGGTRSAARKRPLRVAIITVTIASLVALTPVLASAQAPANDAPPPPGALGDCGTGPVASTQGYGDASPAEAGDLLTHGFPCIFDSLAADPPPASGQDAVDLSLQSDGDNYKPANPLVPLTLPADLGGELTVGQPGIGVEVRGADSAAAAPARSQPLVGEGLFYPDAAQATDVFLAPITTGVELVDQVRAPESPDHLTMDFELPADGSVHATGDGGAQVLQRNAQSGTDEAVGSVHAPQAIDANGDPVAATMTVNGDSIELDVPHSDPGIAYPIAVTTAVTAPTITPGFDPYVGDDSTGYFYVNSMAGQVVRTHTAWCSIEGSSQGQWLQSNINDLRTRLHTIEAAGLKPLLEFGTGAPGYAKMGSATCANSPAISSTYKNSYGTAAKTLVQCLKDVQPGCPYDPPDTYGNLVSSSGVPLMQGIELGNEVNSNTWWNDGGASNACDSGDIISQCDAGLYGDAAANAVAQIKSISTVAVSTSGLSYGSPDGHAWNSKTVDATSYLDYVLSGHPAMGMDAIAFHPYGPQLHPSFQSGCGAYCESHVVTDINLVRATADNNGYNMLPLWITEVGVDADYDDSCEPSGSGSFPSCVTPTEESWQASHLQYIWTTILNNCAWANVSLAVFWSLEDDAGLHSPYYAGFMFNGFDSSKDAYGYFASTEPPPPGYGGGFYRLPLNFNTCLG